MNSCGGFPVVNFVSPALFSFIMCFPFELCFGHGLCHITSVSVSAWKININEFFFPLCAHLGHLWLMKFSCCIETEMCSLIQSTAFLRPTCRMFVGMNSIREITLKVKDILLPSEPEILVFLLFRCPVGLDSQLLFREMSLHSPNSWDMSDVVMLALSFSCEESRQTK